MADEERFFILCALLMLTGNVFAQNLLCLPSNSVGLNLGRTRESLVCVPLCAAHLQTSDGLEYAVRECVGRVPQAPLFDAEPALRRHERRRISFGFRSSVQFEPEPAKVKVQAPASQEDVTEVSARATPEAVARPTLFTPLGAPVVDARQLRHEHQYVLVAAGDTFLEFGPRECAFEWLGALAHHYLYELAAVSARRARDPLRSAAAAQQRPQEQPAAQLELLRALEAFARLAAHQAARYTRLARLYNDAHLQRAGRHEYTAIELDEDLRHLRGEVLRLRRLPSRPVCPNVGREQVPESASASAQLHPQVCVWFNTLSHWLELDIRRAGA